MNLEREVDMRRFELLKNGTVIDVCEAESMNAAQDVFEPFIDDYDGEPEGGVLFEIVDELDMTEVFRLGWPNARVEDRANHFLAYEDGVLCAEISFYENSKWAFFHYAYGRRGTIGDIAAAIAAFKSKLAVCGWTFALKGPMLTSERLPENARDFSMPTANQLDDLRTMITSYLTKRFPTAKIADVCLYAGMGWVVATNGEDGLGIRDIDVNVFFEAGGPRSLAWITKLKFELNGALRKVDLYWNVLGKNETPSEYVAKKTSTAKSGRWLTIPKRPWVSLVSGRSIWPGQVAK
jgi:hypothetical protein